MPVRIGITVDMNDSSYSSRHGYAEMVARAGAVPILLPCHVASIPEYLAICDAFGTTGVDDPNMEAFGVTNHPRATLIEARRQDFECTLLQQLERTDHPLLAICLGMQLMALEAGGTLDQHLPDTLETAGDHWDGGTHLIEGTLGCGEVYSHHRQAITNPGTLEVVARAPDGVIEAVRHPTHHARLGVQWHPERTAFEPLGLGLFERLAEAARGLQEA